MVWSIPGGEAVELHSTAGNLHLGVVALNNPLYTANGDFYLSRSIAVANGNPLTVLASGDIKIDPLEANSPDPICARHQQLRY